MIAMGSKIVGARTGTAGAVCLRRKGEEEEEIVEEYLLSAGHVLCSEPFACEHLSTIDVLCAQERIATHDRADNSTSTESDVAAARLIPGVEWRRQDLPIELPRDQYPSGGVADTVYVGAGVWKVGAATGFTRGNISSASSFVRLRYPSGERAIEVVVVESADGVAFSSQGDSGAMVYYQSGDAIGMIVAGRRPNRAYVALVRPVLQRLDLELVHDRKNRQS